MEGPSSRDCVASVPPHACAPAAGDERCRVLCLDAGFPLARVVSAPRAPSRNLDRCAGEAASLLGVLRGEGSDIGVHARS